jgi:phage shock protein E
MKSFLAIACMVVLVGTWSTAFAQQPSSGNKPAVSALSDNTDYTAVEFSKQMKEPKAIILDVRAAGEVAQGKIGGSVNIDWNSPSFRGQAGKLDKNAPVYVYCAVGGRSSSAKKALTQMGFKEVHNLLGGIEAWKKAGLPVVK